jgi:formylmethanofuran dehydrogenase subunit E
VPKICQHGKLKRSCEMCDMEREIIYLNDIIASLRCPECGDELGYNWKPSNDSGEVLCETCQYYGGEDEDVSESNLY